MLISSFYMPQRNKKDLDELSISLEKASVSTSKKNIILAGDFNCPDIEWNNMSIKNGNDRDIQQQLIDIANSSGLSQIHDQPTRGDNLLDLVFTANPSVIKSSVSVPGISDHDIVITDLETKPHYQKTASRKIYIYSKANWENLKASLRNLANNISKLQSEGKNIQDIWEFFKSSIHKILDKHIPARELKSRHSTPWITHRERKLLKKKQRLYNQAKKTKNWTNYRQFQKECKSKLRKSEWNYVNNNILEGLNNNNTKPFWKYVKSKKQDSFGIAPLKSGNKLITDSKEKAGVLNKQFQSVFTKEEHGPMPKTSKTCKNPIQAIKINVEGVRKLLSKVNPTKASGPDNIPNRILKECADLSSPG
ncbi:uncharacterized protein LOC134238855 [Saccostrea cucullata]|uniref:uncharacterized protein LOC134238855 n=1 Tax=Saccostrea cuccullata TaxID=36930 RepID=UPI002ED09972